MIWLQKSEEGWSFNIRKFFFSEHNNQDDHAVLNSKSYNRDNSSSQKFREKGYSIKTTSGRTQFGSDFITGPEESYSR